MWRERRIRETAETSLDRYTCEEVFRRLDDYVDRELSPEEAERVREHLAICAACADEYRFETQLVSEIRQKVQRIAVPADLMARVRRSLSREA